MLGCIQPMSSPMMKRIFGCLACAGCCALAGPAAHTDTNAVAPRSTARDAEPKLARLDFSHDVSCGGAFGILEAIVTHRFLLRWLVSNAKILFQSFFMLMTIHPSFFASSYNSWENVPTLVSGSSSATINSRGQAWYGFAIA